MSKLAKPIMKRFLSLVEKTDSCWLWRGKTLRRPKKPYGYIKMPTGNYKGRWALAHRISYELFKGPIPKGLHIDHLCSKMNCVNPAHLEAVTCAENNRRSIEREKFKVKNVEDFVGVYEYARETKQALNTIYQQIYLGKLPAEKLGRKWQIKKTVLEAAIARQNGQPAQPKQGEAA